LSAPDSGEPAYLAALNPAQREAVLHTGGPLLILAGAGSGKTRVITTKIAYLIDRLGFEPESILAVAFTNKAADEMRERVAALCGAGARVMVKTFHSFGAWLLRRYGEALGLARDFTIYDDEDSLALLRAALEDRVSRELHKALAARIARAKDLCLGPDDELPGPPPASPAAKLDFPRLYRLYQERLSRTGNLDFGDLILQSVRLLSGHPDIRDRVRERFRAVLVDEYQDSNHAQFRMLQELHGPDTYLCAVGDEDQSIYGFRGAELENILTFPERFPGTRIIRLEENYRSARNILEVASRVVANNTRRLGKTLWTRKPAGPPVVLALLEDQEQEAQFCAGLLKDRRFAGTAILYRMNFQSRVFETLFSRLGIPFRVVGTVRFYEREEVKDCLAYLALALNPRDEVAFRRAANRPKRGLGERSLEALLESRDRYGGDLVAAARAQAGGSTRASSGLRGLLACLDRFAQALDRSPPASLDQAVLGLIRGSGLLEHYRAIDESEGSEKAANLEELVNATAEYPGSREGLALFLEGITLNSTDENPFARTAQVTLITVHNTKGLEFDRVIITGLEDGVFPHYASTLMGLPVAGGELEEERRLFYVGVTRAREELYLSSCRRRRVFGTLQHAEPSRFLDEIPPELLRLYGSPREEEDRFPLGCGVYHEEYGPGIVTRKWTAEGQPMVAVRFDSGRIARFPVKYSSLERISRDP
jgi:DNA helicase-2/ATP-dependent DNA helicase PcrA